MKRISQGSVATLPCEMRFIDRAIGVVWCGGIFSESVIANFLLILTVKEF